MKSYNNEERNQKYITALCEFINDNYDVNIIDIRPAERGFYGETWKIITLDRTFFAKIDYSPSHQNIYAQSFYVIEYLNKEGIDFISQIIKTKEGKLYVHFNRGVLGIFQWIDGISLDKIDNEIRIAEYRMLARIYKLKPVNIPISIERFEGESAKWFIKEWKEMDKSDMVYKYLEGYRPLLEYKAKRLSYFSKICKEDKTGFVITHGDTNRNIILGNGKYYLIDWDESILSPPERDAWFNLSKWNLDIFNSILRENAIEYELKCDRLSYYGCYSFFLYLKEYIDKYFYELDAASIIIEIDNFINNWLEKEYQYAIE